MISSVTSREKEVITKSIKNNKALRIGESSVASVSVHTINTPYDGMVYINDNADAGQFFYKRSKKGQVIHIDTFHQKGYISHKKVFVRVKRALSYYQKIKKINNCYYGTKLEDYVDVQTATGGGRITGTGRFGKNKKVRQNHINHVHITMLLHPHNYDLILYLCYEVENAILEQGLKLAKIDSIQYENGSSFKRMEEEYESVSDSLLNKELRPKLGQAEGLNIQDIINNVTKDKELYASFNFFSADTGDLNYRIDSTEMLLDTTKDLKKNVKKQIETNSTLTGAKNIFSSKHKNNKKYSDYTLIDNNIKFKSGYRSKSASKNISAGTLAINKTIKNALLRSYYNNEGSLRVTKEDLYYYKKPQKSAKNYLFLFDYSASMEGLRIKAACALIDKLLSWSRDKVAVISIQENNTKLQCDFTRNRQYLISTVKNIEPNGLTPLAEGIELAYDYITSNKFFNAEVVLISDGVPTVSRYGGDPVSEAEFEAAKLKNDGIKFTCVGVKPNQSIMKKIALAGGGRVFITKDISEDILMQIFRREHDRIKAISRIS